MISLFCYIALAAFAVLLSHSYALVLGTSAAEPLHDLLGMTPGTIAVDIFFITSGFLVTGSLLTRKNTFEFIWARFLRIYPALIVMVLPVTLALGLFFSSVPLMSFLTSKETLRFLAKNSTLINSEHHIIYRVFSSMFRLKGL
jgi:peptidoglycan/LPS O-acetylase OafA/YrhL